MQLSSRSRGIPLPKSFDLYHIPYIACSVHVYYQELMSHPKGGEGAFNYVVTALSKVLAVL